MRQVSRRLNALGFTLIEILVVIFVITFLLAVIFGAAGRMRERTKVTQSRKLVETVHNAMEAYRMDFRDYPPDASGAYAGAEAALYFLTTVFRITPNVGAGEAPASINAGPYAKFNEGETRDNGSGRLTLVDAWNTPLRYRRDTYTEADPWGGAAHQTFRIVLYSFGPNKLDDGGAGDDIQVKK